MTDEKSWKRLVERQEPMGEPFDSILHDNLESLHVETPIRQAMPSKRPADSWEQEDQTEEEALVARQNLYNL